MKYLILLFCLMFVSCVKSKHTYICGDKPCLDKKEFKEYFAKNLIVEIKTKKLKENNSVDLVKLNTPASTKNLKKESSFKEEEKINKKEEKIRLKAQRAKLKEERKIKKSDERNKAKMKKKLAKLNKNSKKKEDNINYIPNIIKTDETAKKTINAPIINTKKIIKKNNQVESYDSVKSENQLSVCENVKDCDIDKIAELLIKKGKEKDFPNISSN